MELGDELPTESGGGVSLDGDMKTSFSVDEAGQIGIKPFLLIVRTEQIVTEHRPTLTKSVTMNEYCRIHGVSSK